MKLSSVFAVLAALCLSLGLARTASAALFKVEIIFSESGDTFNEDELGKGWKKVEKDFDTKYTQTFMVEKLPWEVQAGHQTSFKIEKNGQVTARYSYGDVDGTAEASVSLPKVGGKFIIADKPCELLLSGGDHASGTWGVDGQMLITTLGDVIGKKKDVKKPALNVAKLKRSKQASEEEAREINVEGYSKLDESKQKEADDPSDVFRFRVVAYLEKPTAKNFDRIEKWLSENYASRGLKFWISRSKKTVTLYGTIHAVTEALSNPDFDRAE